MNDPQEEGYLKKRINAFMIGNAIVWGAVIVGTALVLRGTEYMSKLTPIFAGGAVTSIVILGGGLLRKK